VYKFQLFWWIRAPTIPECTGGQRLSPADELRSCVSMFISLKFDHPFRSKLNHPEQPVKEGVKIGLEFGYLTHGISWLFVTLHG
jgi:hypothetical protein